MAVSSNGVSNSRPEFHVCLQQRNESDEQVAGFECMYLSSGTTKNEKLTARHDSDQLRPGRIEFSDVCGFGVDIDYVDQRASGNHQSWSTLTASGS